MHDLNRTRFFFISVMVLGGLCFSPQGSAIEILSRFRTLQRNLNEMEKFNGYNPPECPGESNPNCSELFENYCDQMYSPENQGNIQVGHGENALQIKFGQTSNGFSQSFYIYEQAKIAGRDRIPKDLRSLLDEKNYFRLLSKYLSRKPQAEMSDRELEADLRLASELSAIWNSSWYVTVQRRMTTKYPGFSRLNPSSRPPEMDLELTRTAQTLNSEMAVAVWEKHEKWQRTADAFETIRSAYVDEVKTLAIPEDLKHAWLTRLREIRLRLPGSDPGTYEHGCATTKVNAFYNRPSNTVTVCGGEFTIEDPHQTLAHEFGHALDLGSEFRNFIHQSDLGSQLKTLVENSCTNKHPTCTEWQNFKDKLFPQSLKSLSKFSVPLSDFMSCLQARDISQKPSAEYYSHVASGNARNEVSNFASNNRFLKMIKNTMVMDDGSKHQNPNFMNPCGEDAFPQKDGHLHESYILSTLFVNEYRCNTTSAPDQRLREAISSSGGMLFQYYQAILPLMSEYSEDYRLKVDGFSEEVNEQFADFLGQRALARVLGQLSDVQQRRNAFFASLSWLCNAKTIQERYPEEAEAQKIFDPEEHPLNSTRRKNVLTPEIREILQCKKDASKKDCDL